MMHDREKVVKGLEVCLKTIDQQDCPNDCPYLSDCLKYENRVIFQPLMRDALALLKEQEWISIKERMPDKQGYYLVSGGGEVWICEMLILGNIKGWSNSALRPSVEAWMPFSKPYKEGR